MEVDLKVLGKLARVCRKHGIAYLKKDGLELSLTIEAPKVVAQKPNGRLIEVKLPESYKNLTDDELLFGSNG